MTNNVYPPDHLLRKWTSLIIDEEENVDVVLYEAFQAGADQELDACCEWFLSEGWHPDHPSKLRAARRPKPPSLKEQALDMLDRAEWNSMAENLGNEKMFGLDEIEIIRRALESLDD